MTEKQKQQLEQARREREQEKARKIKLNEDRRREANRSGDHPLRKEPSNAV